MTDLTPEIIEEVYKTLLKWEVDEIGDIASETIIRMMERHSEEPIKDPLRWAKRTAHHVRRELFRSSIQGVSFDTTDGVPGSDDLEDDQKSKVKGSVREDMTRATTDDRDPESLAEQRDFLQKIDPNWREHLEEGVDFGFQNKIPRNERKVIQRRARALLKEGVIC
jgi:hypothetical protein